MTTQYPTLGLCIVTTDVSLKPNSFHIQLELIICHTNANYLHTKLKCFLTYTVSTQQWPAIKIAHCVLPEAGAWIKLLFPC